MVFEQVIGTIIQLIDTIFIYINGLVYDFISFVYQIFLALAGAQLFTAQDYQDIANRIYIIIGVVSLFLISYALLKTIVDPEGTAKSEYSANKIIPNVIKVVMFIGLTPVVFQMAYKLQDVIVNTNVIPRIILDENYGKGTSDSGSSNYSYDQNGRQFANSIFTSFMYSKDYVSDSSIEIEKCYFPSPDCNGIQKDAIEELEDSWEGSDDTAYNFEMAIKEVNEGKKNFQVYANFGNKMHGENKVIEYNPIFQLIAGIIVIYVLINFCIDLGVRAVKLGYYQLIAPIPILTIMIPGQNKVFNNWLKSTITTFVDVFFRIAIFFIGLFAIDHLPSLDNLWANSSFATDSAVYNFARVFIIIGILLFIKQAPKLLSDLFGIQGGAFKLGIKDKLTEAFDLSKAPLVGRAEGAVTGATGAAWTAAWNGGNIKDAVKLGAWNGSRDKGLQFDKQRTNMWESVYGMKGPTGWFGGRPVYNKVADELKNTANDRFLQPDPKKGLGSNSRRIQDMEKSTQFRDLKNKHSKDITSAVNELKSAESPYITKIESINLSIDAKNTALNTAQTDVQKLEADHQRLFNEAKNSYITDLESQRTAALKSGDAAGVTYYGQKIQEVQNGNATTEIMDYIKTNDAAKYAEITKNEKDRSTIEADITRINNDIASEQKNLEIQTAAMNSDKRILAAKESLTKYKFTDSDGKVLNYNTGHELNDAINSNKDYLDNAAKAKAKDEFRKANDEYKWRTEAEEKERREVDISQAKKDPALQAQAEMFKDIFKSSGGDKK